MASEYRAPKKGRLAALLFAALISVYLIGLLIGPRVPDAQQSDYCVSNYHFVWVFGHSLNCDSSEFLVNAKEPASLLAPDAMRQERPGASALVHVISWPLDLVYRALRGDGGLQFERNIDPSGRIAHGRVERITDKAQYAPQYAGFIILHAVVLLACLALYVYAIGLRPLRWELFSLPSFWLGSLVIVNNVTKQFFWSPHTQLFNILAAVGGIAACVALSEATQRHRVYWAASFAFGVMLLFYGIFLVPVIVTGLIYLTLEFRDSGVKRAPWGRLLSVNAVAVALFGAPYLAWYALVVWLNGDFGYTYERFGHFTWAATSYASDGIRGVAHQFGAYWLIFFKFAALQGWGVLILLAVVAGFAVRAEQGKGSGFDQRAKIAIAAGLLYIVLVSLFIALYGLPRYRLSFAVLVAILVIVGLFMRRLEQASPRPQALLTVTAGGLTLYAIWAVAKFGPYS